MVFDTRLSVTVFIVSLFIGLLIINLPSNSMFIPLALFILIVINVIVYLYERKKYEKREQGWIKSIYYNLKRKKSFKLKVKLNKKDCKTYWKYSFLFGFITCLSWFLLDVIRAYILPTIIKQNFINLLIISFLMLISLYSLTFLSLVKIKNKVKKFIPYIIAVRVVLIFIFTRQIVSIIVQLFMGVPWSFWFLLPTVAILEIAAAFIVPWAYVKWRNK